MLKTILVDDEPKVRAVLELKLKDKCPEVEVIGLASSVSEAYELIKKESPDLLFLDIAMPGESGFDLIARFDKINFDIIFVTGFNEYAIDALRVSAVDYLLKPVINDELIKSVQKAKERKKQRDTVGRYEILKHNINHMGDQQTKIAIPGVQAYDFITVGDIIRCEGWQKYTKIYLKDSSCILSSYNLGVYKTMLDKFSFYSCHKSHFINTKHVIRY